MTAATTHIFKCPCCDNIVKVKTAVTLEKVKE